MLTLGLHDAASAAAAEGMQSATCMHVMRNEGLVPVQLTGLQGLYGSGCCECLSSLHQKSL